MAGEAGWGGFGAPAFVERGPQTRFRAAADKGAKASWPAVIADHDSLTETEVDQDGKRFLLRSSPRPGASLALSALGVALPPTLRQIADA